MPQFLKAVWRCTLEGEVNYRRLESEFIIDYIIIKKLLFNHSFFCIYNVSIVIMAVYLFQYG